MCLEAPVRWGIIGVGDVCKFKSGPAFAKADGSKLVAVCRRTVHKAKEYAELHNVAKWYSNPNDLIEDSDVDAIYIATPPDSHLELGLAVARAGKPCLMEKPMARNAMEAAVLAAAFEKINVPLYVAYYRRALPKYKLAKEWVPKLGIIESVSCTVRQPKKNGGWRHKRSIAGGGLTIDKGSHCMDVIDYMLGPVLVQRAAAGRRSPVDSAEHAADVVEDFCHVDFSLPSGTMVIKGAADFDFNSSDNICDEIEIKGSEGVLSFAALGLRGSSPFVTFRNVETGTIDSKEFKRPEHTHFALIQEIVHDLRKGEQNCSATASAGLRTALVIDAALEKSSPYSRLCTSSFDLSAQ